MIRMIVSAVLSFFLIVPVYAEGAASLSVSALPGSEIIAFYAAEETDEGYESLVSDIEDIESVSADYIISSGSLAELSYVTAIADDDGYAVFEGLEAGVYLIAQNGIAEDENGVEYDFEPYLAVVSEGENSLESDVQTVDDIEYAELYGTQEEADDMEEEESSFGVGTAVIVIAAAAVLIALFTISTKFGKKKKSAKKEETLDDVLDGIEEDGTDDKYYDDAVDEFYDD